MTPEEIQARPARTVDAATRQAYFDRGAALVADAIDAAWLDRLRAGVSRLVERSRAVTASDAVFDLEPGHTAETPRLRRVSSPCDHDPVFWEALTDGPIGDIAVDILGPDVKFYQSKLNFKWARGGAEVRWHQDAPFFPHTNHAVATFGVYLEDCGLDQGPLRVLPDSHRGPLYDHRDEEGVWRGELKADDSAGLNDAVAQDLVGPAGSVTVHNCRTLHASRPNLSDRGRPLLLYVLSAADAIPYTAQPLPSRYEQSIVRGRPAATAHVEAGRIDLPPDWSGGYTSIFATQAGDRM